MAWPLFDSSSPDSSFLAARSCCFGLGFNVLASIWCNNLSTTTISLHYELYIIAYPISDFMSSALSLTGGLRVCMYVYVHVHGCIMTIMSILITDNYGGHINCFLEPQLLQCVDFAGILVNMFY